MFQLHLYHASCNYFFSLGLDNQKWQFLISYLFHISDSVVNLGLWDPLKMSEIGRIVVLIPPGPSFQGFLQGYGLFRPVSWAQQEIKLFIHTVDLRILYYRYIYSIAQVGYFYNFEVLEKADFPASTLSLGLGLDLGFGDPLLLPLLQESLHLGCPNFFTRVKILVLQDLFGRKLEITLTTAHQLTHQA